MCVCAEFQAIHKDHSIERCLAACLSPFGRVCSVCGARFMLFFRCKHNSELSKIYYTLKTKLENASLLCYDENSTDFFDVGNLVPMYCVRAGYS